MHNWARLVANSYLTHLMPIFFTGECRRRRWWWVWQWGRSWAGSSFRRSLRAPDRGAEGGSHLQGQVRDLWGTGQRSFWSCLQSQRQGKWRSFGNYSTFYFFVKSFWTSIHPSALLAGPTLPHSLQWTYYVSYPHILATSPKPWNIFIILVLPK